MNSCQILNYGRQIANLYSLRLRPSCFLSSTLARSRIFWHLCMFKGGKTPLDTSGYNFWTEQDIFTRFNILSKQTIFIITRWNLKLLHFFSLNMRPSRVPTSVHVGLIPAEWVNRENMCGIWNFVVISGRATDKSTSGWAVIVVFLLILQPRQASWHWRAADGLSETTLPEHDPPYFLLNVYRKAIFGLKR